MTDELIATRAALAAAVRERDEAREQRAEADADADAAAFESGFVRERARADDAERAGFDVSAQLEAARASLDAAEERAERRYLINGATKDAVFLRDVADEVARARSRFPSSRMSMCALTEEVGELAQALLKVACGKWPRERIREEAVQVAGMALRVAVEGDDSITAFVEPSKEPT